MRSTLISFLALAAVSFGQQEVTNDGDPHGDAPYLIEPGWRPLLNGKDLTGWHGAYPNAANEWMTVRGVLWERLLGPTHLVPRYPEPSGKILNGPHGSTVNLVTDEKFGDLEAYAEFILAEGSNSGFYMHGLYEVQIFDSYGTEHKITSSDGGGIYHRWVEAHDGIPAHGEGGSAPLVNASRRPGEWQSYQIWFRAPRFDASGKKIENARYLRVLHNGRLVQEDVECSGPTRAALNIPEAAMNPIMLQGDHGPVAFQNIYVRPLRPLIHR